MYAMIHLATMSTLLNETVKVEVSRVERVARGEKSESVSIGREGMLRHQK